MKKTFSFIGGVFPKTNKITAGTAIEDMPLPSRVVIPLLQHSGEASRALVSKGDSVLHGQKIAQASNGVSVPQHASLSGRVSDVCFRAHPLTGKPVECVIIESDGKDSKAPLLKNYADYYSYTAAELVSAVKEAGIAGMGGAGYPTHIKLSPPRGAEIDMLVINAVECEPYITADDSLIREQAKVVVEGAKFMMHMLNAVKCLIAVEADKKAAIEVLRKIVYNEPNIELAVLKVKYPQGSEMQLIRAITGREVPSECFPCDIGVVVQNAATAYAVSRVLKSGEPLTSRIITVSGSAVKKPKNLRVRIGTLAGDIAKFCGADEESTAKFIMGGPMTGVAQPSLDVPVIKTTNGILLLKEEDNIGRDYFDCIKCGKCTRVCPMLLYPGMLSISSQNADMETANKYYPDDCIECGSCAYVCPSKRPIVQQIKRLKQQVTPDTGC